MYEQCQWDHVGDDYCTAGPVQARFVLGKGNRWLCPRHYEQWEKAL